MKMNTDLSDPPIYLTHYYRMLHAKIANMDPSLRSSGAILENNPELSGRGWGSQVAATGSVPARILLNKRVSSTV